MQAVNLLPRELIAADRRGKLPLPLIGAGAVPLISLALLVTGYVSAHGQVGTVESQLAAVNAQLATLAPAKLKEQAAQQQQAAAHDVIANERTARLTSLQSALATATPADVFLAAVARVIPANVWLTALTYQEGTGPQAGGSFSIQGYTYNQPSVAQLLARLQLMPTLTAVTFTNSSQTSVGSKTLVQFTINATPVTAAPPTTTTAASTTTTPATSTPAP